MGVHYLVCATQLLAMWSAGVWVCVIYDSIVLAPVAVSAAAAAAAAYCMSVEAVLT
jgi:hypothetical protein